MARAGPRPDFDGLLQEATAAGFEPLFGPKAYQGRRSQGPFRCAAGHVVTLRTKVIRATCPLCTVAMAMAARFKRLQAIARRQGGQFVGAVTDCRNWHSHVPFECHHGHRWDAQISNVVYHHSWCPYCAQSERVRARWAARRRKPADQQAQEASR